MTLQAGLGEVVGSALVLGSAAGAFAAGSITSNGAIGVPAAGWRTGVGVYVVPLNEAGGGLSREEHDFIATPQGAVDIACSVQWNNALQVTVRTFTANTGVALDADFTLTIMRNRRINN